MFKEVIYYQRPYGKKYDLTPHIKREEYKDMLEASKALKEKKNDFLLWVRINKVTGERFIRTANKEFLETL